jgi:type III restriction enzyme
LLPVRPGKAAGNDLGALDRRALRGNEINYLASLSDLMVINDEAHHIHEIRKNGETEEVEWQKGLNKISEDKGKRFIQVDFSATPYDTKGSGKNMVKSYFPHIVVDFDLAQAMRQGLVKTLLLDRRAELTDLEDLDYKAERDERGKVIGLSDGQRLMLRAGLTKLRKLENDFVKTDTNKNPRCSCYVKIPTSHLM